MSQTADPTASSDALDSIEGIIDRFRERDYVCDRLDDSAEETAGTLVQDWPVHGFRETTGKDGADRRRG